MDGETMGDSASGASKRGEKPSREKPSQAQYRRSGDQKGVGSGEKAQEVFPMSGCDLKELTMTELKALYIKEFSKTNTSQLCFFLGTGNMNRRKYF